MVNPQKFWCIEPNFTVICVLLPQSWEIWLSSFNYFCILVSPHHCFRGLTFGILSLGRVPGQLTVLSISEVTAFRLDYYDICWIKIDQLDVTCFIISPFNAQHVSNVSTSIFRSLRLISWVVLLWFDVCWCYGVVRLGWCGILMQTEALVPQPA